MRFGAVKIVLSAVLILYSVVMTAQNHYAAVFYNVQNLYDTINDTYLGDDEMLPLSDNEWSSGRYRAKIDNVTRVIADMASLCDYPAIVGLAEVENRRVVEDIANSRRLSDLGYGVCHHDSDDERGIDVALMYRRDMFRLHGSRAVKVDVTPSTRDILLVSGELCGDSVVVMIMHWTSRVGGEYATRPLREACASGVRQIVDSLHAESPNTTIIIMGDMNDTPQSRSIRKIVNAGNGSKSLLYNPFAKGVKRGTLVYDNRWYIYDQIILSRNMLSDIGLCRGNGAGNVKIAAVGIFAPHYLTDRRGFPLPTYRNGDYLGGVSDHLPVYVIVAAE